MSWMGRQRRGGNVPSISSAFLPQVLPFIWLHARNQPCAWTLSTSISHIPNSATRKFSIRVQLLIFLLRECLVHSLSFHDLPISDFARVKALNRTWRSNYMTTLLVTRLSPTHDTAGHFFKWSRDLFSQNHIYNPSVRSPAHMRRSYQFRCVAWQVNGLVVVSLEYNRGSIHSSLGDLHRS